MIIQNLNKIAAALEKDETQESLNTLLRARIVHLVRNFISLVFTMRQNMGVGANFNVFSVGNYCTEAK